MSEVEEGTEDVVFVAVKVENDESEETLMWALKNVPGSKVALVHVQRPVHFFMSPLNNEQVEARQKAELEKIDATLNKYASICEREKMNTEKIIIRKNDVAKGLLELISQRKVTKFVMGAAADKYYSRNMKVPKSRTALRVKKGASSWCNIWFICGGSIICTRFTSGSTSGSSPSGMDDTTSQSGSTSIHNDDASEFSSIIYHSEHDLENNNTSFADDQQDISGADDDLYEKLQELITEVTKLKCENCDEFHKRQKAERVAVQALSRIKVLEKKIDEEIELRKQTDEELQKQNLEHENLRSLHDQVSKDFGATYDQKVALEAHLAETNSMSLTMEQKLKEAQSSISLLTEKNDQLQDELEFCQKERDDAITESNEREMLEVELRRKQEEMTLELRSISSKNMELEYRLAERNSAVIALEERLLTIAMLVNSLEKERDDLQHRKDSLIREIEELRRERVGESSNANKEIFMEFSCSEIQQATRDLDDELKIGEGGFGSVYKGRLHHTNVAIKVMSPSGMQGSSEFHCEVEILCKMRHPNLVTLIGACLEAKALVYEYLPNGSLEDRLLCKGGSPPLPWQARIRICMEICSALIFLHSNNPRCVVHGDLKPDNVLLDANLVSKLSDFGISRLMVHPTTTSAVYHITDPKGTYVYMDPELLSTGILTPQSDTYAFGILMLRVLTGKRPLGIVRLVQDALDGGRLEEILDRSAGEWPFVQAQQLAYLGLRCSAMNRTSRPNLATEVLTVLEPMMRTLPGPSYFLSPDENENIPSYFVCPIFQEIMRDPQIAADGFTYEAEALKGWLEAGRNTSPMTNTVLPNNQLIPNHALRSAIQEWLQHRHRS